MNLRLCSVANSSSCGAARGRAIVVAQDLAYDAGGRESREPREIDGGLRVPDALEHAAWSRAERLHMAAEANVAGTTGRVSGHANGLRAVLRADASRNPVLGRRIDALRVRRSQRIIVPLANERESQLLDALGRERETDQAARALRHEVDDLRRHQLCGADEVTLVLAILVIGDNEHLTPSDRLDRVVDSGELHSHVQSCACKEEGASKPP